MRFSIRKCQVLLRSVSQFSPFSLPTRSLTVGRFRRCKDYKWATPAHCLLDRNRFDFYSSVKPMTAAGVGSVWRANQAEILAARSTTEFRNSPQQPKRGAIIVNRFLKILGPGLITGASDDDPSGIATYAMAGASLGYTPLWTSLVTFPLMAGAQLICARIGLVSGRGLAGIMRRNYSLWWAYPAIVALVIANAINAAADIQAIAAGH